MNADEDKLFANRRNDNLGIATILVVIVVVIVVIVAGVGVFFYASTITSTSTELSTTQTRSTTIPLTTTTTIRTAQSSLTTLSSTGFSASQSGITTYSGTFNFTVPEGPSGIRTFSNDSVQVYNTTQVASGSFTFFIASLNQSGSGTGQGTFTATTSGFCSGSTTFHYTFIIPDATTILGGNLTVFFSSPNPPMFSVQLSCTGDMSGVNTSTNNPSPYLPTYPNEISVNSATPTLNVHQSAGFSYYFNIVKTS